MVVAEGGAAARDSRRHTGQVHGHDVGVALDDDRLAGLGDLPLGLVEPEQHLRLVVDGRLGGVEVLGLDAVVVEEPPGAEPDDVAAEVADRPQQAALEPVAVAALAGDRQPGLLQFVEGVALREQVLGELLPARRREPAAEGLRGRLVEPALGEELAGLLRLAGLGELIRVELGRELVRREQPRARAAVALHRRAAALVGEPVADPVGELLDRLHEPQLLDLHDEVDDAAALAAAEAVARVVGGADVERRGLLVVERAEALHRAGAGGAEGDVVADHLLDPVPVAHLRDVGVPDPPCHGGQSRTPPRPSGAPPPGTT